MLTTSMLATYELLARIRALTRRADQAQSAMIAWQGLRIDLLSHRVWRDDQEVPPTGKFFNRLARYRNRFQNSLNDQ